MSSIRKITWVTLVCGLSSVLAACGGGGDGGDAALPPDPQVTVPLSAAMANFVNQTKSSQMTIDGLLAAGGQTLTITGSGTLTETSGSATFEGRSALRKNSEPSGTLFANGEPTAISGASQLYFDTNYQPLGSTSSDSYCVVSFSNALPASAKAGDGGAWYGENCFTDSSKAVSIGANSIGYAVESDTATSLLLNVLQSLGDPGGATLSATTTFRVDTSGQIARVREVTRAEGGGASLTMTTTFR